MALTDITLFFLGFSIVFYVLFGGADFGAGTLGLISGTQVRQTIADAIGPVWEANHVWLVLAIVILFMGFPKVYATMTLYLHIPLLLMLIGIVLRGTAFTFMHYDAIKDHSNKIYNWVFKISSVITPFFLGVIIGAMVLGKVDPQATTFYDGFIVPWFNAFSFFVGLFCIVICTFLAAVYLIGETTDEEERALFITSARRVNVVVVIIGGFVFISAWWDGLPLLQLFYKSWVSSLAIILATITLFPLWRSLTHKKIVWSRVLAGFQVILILFAWFWVQHPTLVNITGPNRDLTIYNASAPEATLYQLVVALIIGACLILPFLFFMIKIFKGKQFVRN